MIIIKILTSIAFLGSIGWLIAQPGWEPAIALITTLIALIAEFAVKKKVKSQPRQRQTISNRSTGYQAGRDIKIDENSKKGKS